MSPIAFRSVAAVAVAFAFGLTAPVLAQSPEYPVKPVRLVVPYPPAGSVDFIARIVQPAAQEAMRQNVVIDNRPGASAMIGSALVAKAVPDGYTLLLGGGQPHAMNPGVIKVMPYDSIRDFTPITQTTRANWMLVAGPAMGVKTPAELVAAIRARPDRLTYASSGSGSAAHLAFSMLAAELKLGVIHVPFKGIAQGISEVLGGQINFVMSDQSTLLPHVRAGKLVPIAMTGNARSTLVPEVPTIAETLVPGFDVQAWQGIWAPPGMTAELAGRINAIWVKALRSPDVAENLRASGVDPVGSSVPAFSAFIRRALDRWVGAARRANVEPE